MNSTELTQRIVLICALITAPGFPRQLHGQLEKFILHDVAPDPRHANELAHLFSKLKFGPAWKTAIDVARLVDRLRAQLETAAAGAPPVASETPADWRKAA
jgi:hypothetical protein